MIIGTDGKPIAHSPEDGAVYIVKGIGQTRKTRKTYLFQNGKKIDLSNRHMRRAYMAEQKLTNRSHNQSRNKVTHG